MASARYYCAVAIARNATELRLTDEMVDGFLVAPGTKVKLERWSTKWDVPAGLEDLNKEQLKREADELVKKRVRELAELQDLLWADGRYALLLVFQGLDASGKDSTIKHVTCGMNPAGVRVVSFKEPSREELRHNYLWRYVKALPERGEIGVFNRSHYEEVCVVRVKPELLRARPLPVTDIDDSFWLQRFEDINLLEQHLTRSGTIVLKFFLHLSKQEQKKRLLRRLQDPQKQWKFSQSDIADRGLWDDYHHAFEEMLSHTSTSHAPWWIIPADRKWAMRALVAHAISKAMKGLDLRYPPVDDEKRKVIQVAIEKLNSEA
jgi:PPK2 family polyphosphate:nucleotide phosphotransferase